MARAETMTPDLAAAILGRLRVRHPDAHIELSFTTPLELLVATVLSAQCTDVKVNQVTAGLFRKYRTPADYLAVPPGELEGDIHSIGLFRRKAASLRRTMDLLIREHGGTVPGTIEALTALPGVGRKTANVILGNAFGVPGVVVDTHVLRVSGRLGLTRSGDPEKIEQELMRLFPPDEWVRLSHTLIFHGRRLCHARRPACAECPVCDLCSSAEV